MVRELMPDYVAEEFYQDLIPSHVFEVPEKPRKETNRCIVFCKKIGPNVFDIKNGLAVMRESGTNFNDGVCMISPATEVVFVFE